MWDSLKAFSLHWLACTETPGCAVPRYVLHIPGFCSGFSWTNNSTVARPLIPLTSCYSRSIHVQKMLFLHS